jgi:hypothetical protein
MPKEKETFKDTIKEFQKLDTTSTSTEQLDTTSTSTSIVWPNSPFHCKKHLLLLFSCKKHLLCNVFPIYHFTVEKHLLCVFFSLPSLVKYLLSSSFTSVNLWIKNYPSLCSHASSHLNILHGNKH